MTLAKTVTFHVKMKGGGFRLIQWQAWLTKNMKLSFFHKVQFSSVTWSCPTLWDSADRQASLSITNSWSLLKLMSIDSVMPSNHLILCCPLFLPPSIFPSIRVFSNKSVLLIRWPKYWSFSFSLPMNQSFQWIFRTDFL